MKAVVEARAAVARANAPIGEVFGSQIAGTVSYSTRRPSGVILGITHGISHPARQCARRYLRWSMAMQLSLSLRVWPRGLWCWWLRLQPIHSLKTWCRQW